MPAETSPVYVSIVFSRKHYTEHYAHDPQKENDLFLQRDFREAIISLRNEKIQKALDLYFRDMPKTVNDSETVLLSATLVTAYEDVS